MNPIIYVASVIGVALSMVMNPIICVVSVIGLGLSMVMNLIIYVVSIIDLGLSMVMNPIICVASVIGVGLSIIMILFDNLYFVTCILRNMFLGIFDFFLFINFNLQLLSLVLISFIKFFVYIKFLFKTKTNKITKFDYCFLVLFATSNSNEEKKFHLEFMFISKLLDFFPEVNKSSKQFIIAFIRSLVKKFDPPFPFNDFEGGIKKFFSMSKEKIKKYKENNNICPKVDTFFSLIKNDLLYSDKYKIYRELSQQTDYIKRNYNVSNVNRRFTFDSSERLGICITSIIELFSKKVVLVLITDHLPTKQEIIQFLQYWKLKLKNSKGKIIIIHSDSGDNNSDFDIREVLLQDEIIHSIGGIKFSNHMSECINNIIWKKVKNYVYVFSDGIKKSFEELTFSQKVLVIEKVIQEEINNFKSNNLVPGIKNISRSDIYLSGSHFTEFPFDSSNGDKILEEIIEKWRNFSIRNYLLNKKIDKLYMKLNLFSFIPSIDFSILSKYSNNMTLNIVTTLENKLILTEYIVNDLSNFNDVNVIYLWIKNKLYNENWYQKLFR